MSRRPATFWDMSRAMGVTWAIVGLAWLWDKTSPLGWWTLKPRTQEERAMAKYYQRSVPPYPGGDPNDQGDGSLPARFVRSSRQRGSGDAAVEAHEERLEREARKLWLRMRREAAKELLEQQLHETVAPSSATSLMQQQQQEEGQR